MRNRKWLNGKNVLISGVSSGIGADLARILINKYNCKILGIARSIPKLEKLKAELNENFTYLSMDISTKENWEKIKQYLLDNSFYPDIVINNAGIIQPVITLENLSDDEVNKVISTNFLSVVYSMRTLLPLIKKSNTPSIINVSSASAYLPVAGASIYSATKSAVLSLSEVAKEELMDDKFYIAAVMPGPVKTDLYKPREGEVQSKVQDNLIENFGLTSIRAAKIIIRKMRRCKSRITVGGIAAFMSGFYRMMPKSSIYLTGKMIRLFPLKTYKALFNKEKVQSDVTPNNKNV